MTIHYYGTSGPRVQLSKGTGGTSENFTLSAARREEGDPWEKVQTVRDDINYITRKKVHGFRYRQTFYFEPVADNTELERLLRIANWVHRVEWFPASDQPLVHFQVEVLQGTPYLFTQAGYTAFVLQVQSTNLLPRIPSIDAQGEVVDGPGINAGLTIGG